MQHHKTLSVSLLWINVVFAGAAIPVSAAVSISDIFHCKWAQFYFLTYFGANKLSVNFGISRFQPLFVLLKVSDIIPIPNHEKSITYLHYSGKQAQLSWHVKNCVTSSTGLLAFIAYNRNAELSSTSISDSVLCFLEPWSSGLIDLCDCGLYHWRITMWMLYG